MITGVIMQSCSPIAPGTGTSKPNEGLWQDAHVMFSAPDRRGSKNRALPSAAFSGVYGLDEGKGIAAGR